jgi:hypothetical protein
MARVISTLHLPASFAMVRAERIRSQLAALLPRKGVTCRDVSGLKSLLEPMRPLFGTSVCEGIRVHLSSRHSLKAVVPYGRSGAQGFVNVTSLQNVALRCGMAPYAGQAIGLQLKPY